MELLGSLVLLTVGLLVGRRVSLVLLTTEVKMLTVEPLAELPVSLAMEPVLLTVELLTRRRC